MGTPQRDAARSADSMLTHMSRGAVAGLGLGALCSVAGDQVASISLVLSAATEHSALLVTVLFVIELVPGVVLGGVLGRYVDRHSVRQMWVGGLVLQTASVGAASLAPGLWAKAALVGVTYCFGVVSAAAGFRAFRELAGAGTNRLNGLLGSARSTGNVAGAALGGIGLAAVGLRSLLALDAGSFLVFAVVVAAITSTLNPGTQPEPPQSGAPRTWTRELRILQSPQVFGTGLLGAVTVMALAISFEGVVGVFYLRNTARMSSGAFGVVIACWSVGSAMAALAMARWSSSTKRTFPTAGFVMGATVAITALLVNPWAIGAVYLIGGAANGAFNVATANAVHDGVPEESLGAVWAVFGSIINLTVLVGYIGGGLGASYPRPVMGAAGLACAAAALAAGVGIHLSRRRSSKAGAA